MVFCSLGQGGTVIISAINRLTDIRQKFIKLFYCVLWMQFWLRPVNMTGPLPSRPTRGESLQGEPWPSAVSQQTFSSHLLNVHTHTAHTEHGIYLVFSFILCLFMCLFKIILQGK